MAKFLLCIIVLVLVALGIVSFQQGLYDEGVAYFLVAVALILFVILNAYIIRPLNNHLSRDKLVEWILLNQSDIELYGMRWGADYVNKDTLLVNYQLVYSFGYITRVGETNYSLKGSLRSDWVFFFTTFATFILGWWSFPFGPIRTVNAIHSNFSGKGEITIGELLRSKN